MNDGTTAISEAMKPKSGSSSKRMAISSSLNSVHISPRTPKTPRAALDDAEEGVELSLLGEEERHEASRGLDDAEDTHDSKKAIGTKDKKAMVLLCILCKFLAL